MEFTIRLAERSIGVKSIYGDVYELCRGYLTDGAPDFRVVTALGDIALERVKSFREAAIEGIPCVDYPDGYLETLAVYRKIATKMPAYDSFLMHGAVVAVGDRAWLFTAASGTGKTTHVRLWLDHIAGSYVVNGDKPLLRVGEDVTAFGTPWAGKEGMQKNVGVRLRGVVFLERSAENTIERADFSRLLPVLVQQSYRPNDKAALEKTLKLLSELGRRTPLYRLGCNMRPDAAFTAYERLNADASAMESN